MIKMNFKKLGIVLFLCMCLAGFSLSEVSAWNYYTYSDTVDLNQPYIGVDFNMGKDYISEIYSRSFLGGDILQKVRHKDGSLFYSAAGRKDDSGRDARSNIAYIPQKVGNYITAYHLIEIEIGRWGKYKENLTVMNSTLKYPDNVINA
jgi:hypothetical protein